MAMAGKMDQFLYSEFTDIVLTGVGVSASLGPHMRSFQACRRLSKDAIELL